MIRSPLRPVAGAAVAIAAGALALAPLSSSAGAGEPAAAATPPNIVLILVDDMGADDISAMPNVASLLADNGTSFANSFTPFSLCCPDRVSILTGQYAHNHGVLGNGTANWPLGGFQGFHSDNNTIATWLHDVGYQTAFVGKYLNNYGTPIAPARVPPGWDDWHATKGDDYDNARMYENGANTIRRDVYTTNVLTNITTNILDRRLPAAAPLFMWASYVAPHDGIPVDPDDCVNVTGRTLASPSPRTADRNAFAGTPLPSDPSINEADVSDKPLEIRVQPKINADMMRCLTELHQQRLETLQSVDRGVASIVSAVQAAGELKNTVFVFTSDNGYLIGEHRVRQGKVLPYEPSIRVPLVVRGPGFPAGITRQQLVAAIDLAPTFVDLSGATSRRTMDGVSLQAVAAGASAYSGRDIVLEAGPQTIGGPMTFTGLRTKRYKYVEYATGERELYDLQADPFELDNLLGPGAQPPAIAATLRAELGAIRSCAGNPCDRETTY
jgi:N-acetylglucosamine-6-sulfatase